MNQRPQRCLCDQIFGVSDEHCDATTAYLCRSANGSDQPTQFILDGEAVEFNTAVEFTANLLVTAQAPKIVGLEHLGIAAQQACLELAKAARALVRANSAPANHTIWRHGAVTATLGEVLERTELIICINCNLPKKHPRIQQLVSSNEIEVIYATSTQKNTIVFSNSFGVCNDHFLSDLLGCAELLIRGEPTEDNEEEMDPSRQPIKQSSQHLVEFFKAKQHVSFLVDLECGKEHKFNILRDRLASFSKTAHSLAKCVVLNLGGRANELGAAHVSTWSTGFADEVSFLSGYPSSFSTSKDAIFDVILRFENVSTQDSPHAELAGPKLTIEYSDLHSNKNSKQLRIENLSLFPDDFFRFDEVISEFLIEPHRMPTRTGASEFLKAVNFIVRTANQ